MVSGGSDVDVVVALLGRVDVHAARLGEGQEGEEAEEVDHRDEEEHRRPGACRLDQVPREVHHQDPC